MRYVHTVTVILQWMVPYNTHGYGKNNNDDTPAVIIISFLLLLSLVLSTDKIIYMTTVVTKYVQCRYIPNDFECAYVYKCMHACTFCTYVSLLLCNKVLSSCTGFISCSSITCVHYCVVHVNFQHTV